jgi:23S rRNA (pseudouridine1915-N3)-methyltransferase
MKYVLVTVGKFKAPYIVAGMDLYCRRITRYTEFSVIPVKEEKIGHGCNEALIKRKEGERILEKIPVDGYRVALDQQGKPLISEQWFDFLNDLIRQGIKKTFFLIGGPLGLSSQVLTQAHQVLSLSSLTLTHEMSALVFGEQLYRYLTVQAGEKYHR